MNRFCAYFLILSLVLPASAALIVHPGPAAVGAPATSAGAPAAELIPQWSRTFNSFLTSPNPDPEAVRLIARSLASLNHDDPAVKAQLLPLAQALRKAAAPLLEKPIASQATDKQLEAADIRFKILNYPAVRVLLTEQQQNGIGAAAWAYSRHLWEPTGAEWVRKKQRTSETIEAIARELKAERSRARIEQSFGAGPSPDLAVEVLQGDIALVKSDAVLTTVQGRELCAGGVNARIAQANGCFAAQLRKAAALKDGESILARGNGDGPIDKVLFVVDEHKRSLSDVLFEGLKAADKEGLESIAVPALRTGSVFGAIERSYREIVAELRSGVGRFLAEERGTLKKISFVVYHDEKLAASLRNAFTERPERERSLRADLRKATLTGQGLTLTPRKRQIKLGDSPIYGSLLMPWDLKHLMTPHKPVKIGALEDRRTFSKPVTSVLNMPIKMPGTDIRLPVELAQFREFLQKIIDHEMAVNPAIDDFFAYLTVDQRKVKRGETQRRPGVHIDGVQGARYKMKLPPEHIYSASDRLGTVFYDQSFDLTRLDPAKQHVHAELERQADETSASSVPDYDIAFWDSYSVHRGAVAPEAFVRTFVRVEFSLKIYDNVGDTHNPLFDYNWPTVVRPIPANLDDTPLSR